MELFLSKTERDSKIDEGRHLVVNFALLEEHAIFQLLKGMSLVETNIGGLKGNDKMHFFFSQKWVAEYFIKR